jgi:D-glycero-D-manno-heptose 1,7-bisphosphate phosphatase
MSTSEPDSTAPRRAAFLDRDGVLNVDRGYVYRVSEFEWIRGAREAIALLNRAGYRTIVVTNQSGIARGLYTEEHVRALHVWMAEQLQPFDARIDAFYYCPHHPDGAIDDYRRTCACRKPASGMISRAIEEHVLDAASSFLIGDKDSDCEAAAKVGVRSFFFAGTDLLEFVKHALVKNELAGAEAKRSG